MDEQKFQEPRWSWQSKDSDIRVAYMGMDKRVTLADLIAHLRETAPYASDEEIEINFGTVKWTRPATPDEADERENQHAAWLARNEKWERETLKRLREKYEVS